MKNTNIFTAVVAAIWLALLLSGVELIREAYGEHQVGFPNAGQIKYYVGIPAGMFSILAISCFGINYLQRGRLVLKAASVASLFILLPYMMLYTGGI